MTSVNLEACTVYCDVSATARTDSFTGIQRVAHALVAEFKARPPRGYNILTTVIQDERVYVIDDFTPGAQSSLIDLARPPNIKSGDHYLMLDWAPDLVQTAGDWLIRFREQGGKVTTVIHDILPVSEPSWFPDYIRHLSSDWVDFLLRHVDTVACVSRSVADSFARATQRRMPDRASPIELAWFHNGADRADANVNSVGDAAAASASLEALGDRPFFVVLGTIEPRKGHEQALAAFRQLWRDEVDVGLMFIGKAGWMIDGLIDGIRQDPEFGRRLVWISDASDAVVDCAFSRATALLACSKGEGFGLPIIEAACHGLPILARDIPVFREVAGEHALYFRGFDAPPLAEAIVGFMQTRALNALPNSARMPRLNWQSSAAQLLDILSGQRRYLTSQSCN